MARSDTLLSLPDHSLEKVSSNDQPCVTIKPQAFLPRKISIRSWTMCHEKYFIIFFSVLKPRPIREVALPYSFLPQGADRIPSLDSSTEKGARQGEAFEYVSALHQNIRATLLYGKNHVLMELVSLSKCTSNVLRVGWLKHWLQWINIANPVLKCPLLWR